MPDAGRTQPEAGAPSETAKVAAMCRAVHAARGPYPLIFNDTYARDFLAFASDADLLAYFDGQALSRLPGIADVFCIRSRFTEDELAAAMQRGTTQYVVLGAGLDSFAYRRPDLLERLDLYEVDQPATQAWKRRRADELGLGMPLHLHYAPVDFEQQSVTEGLSAAGFDRAKPVFISLLGVTQYLDGEACGRLFRELSKLSSAGCTLALEYILPTESWGKQERPLLEGAVKHYAEIGEPWLTQMSPEDAEQMLRASGFAEVAHLDREAIQERYLHNREDDSSMPLFTALARADTASYG